MNAKKVRRILKAIMNKQIDRYIKRQLKNDPNYFEQPGNNIEIYLDFLENEATQPI